MIKTIIFFGVLLLLIVLARVVFSDYINKAYATMILLLVMAGGCVFEGISALSDIRQFVVWMLWTAIMLVIWSNTLISVIMYEKANLKAKKLEEKQERKSAECEELELRVGSSKQPEEPKEKKTKVKVKKVSRTVDK